MNLEQLYQQFRKSRLYLKNVTSETLRFYDVSWRAVDRFWKIEDTDELSKEVLDNLVISWRKSGLKPVSTNTYISFLNAFLRWLFEEGYTEKHFRLKKLKAELKA